MSKLEAERCEVDYVLTSGVFGRTNNLVRLMTYVCEKYFEGAIDEIKEYNIAVHALGRPETFDPQVDTIVRVTAHAFGLAALCRVWWVPKIKGRCLRRALYSEGVPAGWVVWWRW